MNKSRVDHIVRADFQPVSVERDRLRLIARHNRDSGGALAILGLDV
jgi:hypothetical protein